MFTLIALVLFGAPVPEMQRIHPSSSLSPWLHVRLCSRTDEVYL
jgi:hypothetical protein